MAGEAASLNKEQVSIHRLMQKSTAIQKGDQRLNDLKIQGAHQRLFILKIIKRQSA